MTNVSMRPGGSPVAAENFVAVDNVTIGGSGTTRDPIYVIDSAPAEPQRVSATALQAAEADGTTPVTIAASLTGVGFVNINLADGEVDGFVKTVAIQVNPNSATYRLNATFQPASGLTRLDFAATGGGAVLVWDGTNGWWVPCATLGGSLA